MPAAQLAAEMLEGRALMAANILQVSTLATNGSYNAGDVISIAVDFDEPVAVIAGNPVLNLAVTNPSNVGGLALPATFAGQNYSRTTMYFNYTVQPGDTSTNFDVILSPVGTAIQWGVINTVSDGVPADRNVTAADNTIVDSKTISIDTASPAVPTVGYPTGAPGNVNNPRDAALTLNPIVYRQVPANTLDSRYGVLFGTYNLAAGAGETLQVTINGATYAPLDVISQGPTGVVRQALVADGTTRIWAVDLINDIPVSGVPFAMNPWSTTDSQYYSVVATITDAAGNVSTDPSMNEVRIDMTAPFVTNVTSPLNPGTYGIGTVIFIDVEFNEPIYVRQSPNQGGGISPRLHLNLNDAAGTASKFADFDSIQSSNNLIGNVVRFRYTVQAGDATPDLDYASPAAPNISAFIVGGSSVTDQAGNAINQTLVAPGTAGVGPGGPSGGSLGFNEAIVINTTAPVVANVNSSWGPVGTRYTAVAGEQIPIAVLLSKQVVVTSDPTLSLRIFDRNGLPVARTATYVNNVVTNPNSPTAASTLNFLYTVQPGDTTLGLDLDYLNTGALNLGAPGSIKDLGGNDLSTMLAAPGSATSLGANNDISVQSAPVVTNVRSLTADGTYAEGQVVRLQVAFDRAVTVNGVPTLKLNGAIPNAMAYFFGYIDAAGTSLPTATSSQWLEFRYLVRPGDNTVGLPANELDYASNTELQVGTGAIYSLVSNTTSKGVKTTQNNAVLTLFTGAPGTPNWLGINNNIRIAVDLTKPSAPTLKLNDLGALPDDGVSRDGTVTATFIEVRTDATLPEAQWMQWQYTVKGMASGWLKIDPSITPSTRTFVLPTGVYAIGDVKVELKDPSGNVSDPAGINNKIWVIENDLPAGLLQVSIVDTGASASDGITNNGTITVRDMEPGAQLVISGLRSADKGTKTTTTAAFTVTLPSAPGPVATYVLTPGLYTNVTVNQIDLAGNVGPTTPVNVVLVDQTFPGPTFALATNRIDYTISDLEVFSSVQVYVDDLVTPVYTNSSYDPATAAGTSPDKVWDLKGVAYTLQLTPGQHTVRVVQTDVAGNTQTINRVVDAGIYASSNPLLFFNSPAGAAPAGATLPLMRLPVTSMTINFNVAVQNFSIRSLKLLYNGVTMNLAGATVARVNASTYVLSLPRNLTNLRGTYAVVVNGPSTSIRTLDGLATMNNKSFISWRRG